ncbi:MULTISPECIES: MupA/Atu3671 family FMN-dependent luciferase-like monooxygenase [Pseudomonas]|jgi:natural product biosynthesis luciferase-like monooxygenase protein|uniref:MupA/Atu3671 family FMN-dependent luciferase-like monooxygenase n=3 Tax=Pseudomonas TaxID=286 RepID=UPI000400A2B8|nr:MULTISPECIES: MupA/Atu3671 family FMN-dependent luciferase-like monooxygenase [Pseudomonas]MEB0192204.1 LLM class flavin-dependent oxidoreductase [Pseudomonas sp. CCI1.1]OKP67374.1 beta-ketoacyl synthase [Pseudomonas fluorescens]WPX49559.1 LLM class flavin-dependent oxidoreductase [Pseudomonas sp. CCI1.1]
MDSSQNKIAVVGMWCRFPGANSPAAFWENLCSGKVTIQRLEREAMIADGVAPSDLDHPDYVPYRGLLDDALMFDPASFGMSPAEAALTDPQHRQFLECARLALQDAGIDGRDLTRTAVFAAQSHNEYRTACLSGASEIASFSADVLNGAAHLATSVAYRLGAEGAALTVQTACSSSLVAVHLACQALHAGECDLAIVGGVAIGWPQHVGYKYVPDGIMSRDGQCRPFDAGASGTVRGEGVGILVLQRLSDAQAAERAIRAVICGSAVNNDGRHRMGFSTPSTQGQVRVIRQAFERSTVSVSDISYVETHGTGTAVGDAIELAALSEALHLDDSPEHRVYLGSVKANIGHLDAAAGIAGMIKLILQLQHRKIVPQAAFERLHDESRRHQEQFSFAEKVVPWTSVGALTAAISSFGLGGTNAHLIIQSQPEDRSQSNPLESDAWPVVVPLVSTDEKTLRARYASLCKRAATLGLRYVDVAFTLASHSNGVGARAAIFVSSVDAVRVIDPTTVVAFSLVERERLGTLFVFGELRGAAAVARDLSRCFPVFRRNLAAIVSRVGRSEGTANTVGEHTTALPSQDRLAGLCVQVALARTLAAMGVPVLRVAGYGFGEAAAACVSGALTLDVAAALVLAESASELQDALEMAQIREGISWYSATLARHTSSDDLHNSDFWHVVFEEDDDAVGTLMSETGSVMHVIVGAIATKVSLSIETPHIHFIDTVDQRASAHMTRAIGQAWCLGATINWPLVFEGQQAHDYASELLEDRRRAYYPPAMVRVQQATAVTAPSELTQVSKPVPAEMRAYAKQAFCDALQLEDIDIDTNFFELGGCSLTALDVLERVNGVAEVRISLREFLHEPTIRSLELLLVRNSEEMDGALSVDTITSSALASPARPVEFGLAATAHTDSMGNAVHEHLPRFSVFFFSGETSQHAQPNLYGLVLDAARLADESDFEAIWIPERHFHRFGGLFPAPAVLASAIAAITHRVKIRAGSIVLPLHNPVEIAEQWSVVDNISNGRIGLALAPGFHPTDFVLNPTRYEKRREHFADSTRVLRAMWRGEPYNGINGLGENENVTVLPRPVQSELPVWITAADSESSFESAGASGSNVLTAMLSLDLDGLRQRIAIYRKALNGRPGRVTVMLHTFVHQDPTVVAQIGAGALYEYLDTHLDFASARVSYERVRGLAAADRGALVDHAVGRYLNGGSLIGTPSHCEAMARSLKEIGVDEIACLVDFGVPREHVLPSLVEVASMQAKLNVQR